MSEVKFELKPVEKKPSRHFKKGSKYDPVLDEFLEGKAGVSRLDASEVEFKPAGLPAATEIMVLKPAL